MPEAASAGGTAPRPAGGGALLLAFTRLALQGFGGVLPVAQRELVERLGWLTREQFLQMLSVAQVLPGPNVVNLSLMTGDRFFGWRGAASAMAGALLRGIAVVAAALVVGTAIKLMPALRKNPLGLPLAAALGVSDWLALRAHFALLSLLAIGGATTTAPDMQRFVLGQQGWLTDAQFAASVALAQAAPGANVLFVAVIGYNRGGLAGTLLPSSLLTLHATRWGERQRQARLLRAFTAGLAPLTLGLLLATGWILFEPTERPAGSAVLATITLAILLRTKWSPLVPIGPGAVAGALGWAG